MDDLVSEFTALKISALSKNLLINQCINEVTIGPNVTISPMKPPSIPPIVIKEIQMSPKTNSPRKSPRKCNTDYNYQLMRTIEKKTEAEVYQSLNKHLQTIEEFNKQQKQKKIEQWKHQQALQIQQIQYQEALMLQEINKVEEESKLEFERAAARNLQRQQENDQRLKAKADEQHKMQLLLTAFAHIEKDFVVLFKDIDALFKNNQEAKTATVGCETSFKQTCSQFSSVNSKVKSKKITEQDVHAAKNSLATMRQLKETLKTSIKEHYQKREKEAAEKVALLKKQEDEREKARQAQQNLVQPIVINPDEKDKSMLKHYVELQAFLQTHQQSYQGLVDDKRFQKFKMDLRKAINTPVNAISDVSSEHLRDKYMRLHNLLAGKVVQATDYRINAAEHPQGIAYAMDLLAKMFVKQGDLTISSKPETAFAYATIIVTLWNDFPVFGQLLLAHFYKECPYLVPVIFEKQLGQSDEEFYKLMGYQYNDGVIEKQDKFLKRMTGLSKFYFSIMITHTRRGTASNPHHLGFGWMWLARVLNQEPYVDVTATLIYSFLEVVGSSMLQTYGRQFRKILFYISKFELPLLKPKDSGGPLARLEVLLHKYNKEGGFVKPPGMLSKNFW